MRLVAWADRAAMNWFAVCRRTVWRALVLTWPHQQRPAHHPCAGTYPQTLAATSLPVTGLADRQFLLHPSPPLPLPLPPPAPRTLVWQGAQCTAGIGNAPWTYGYRHVGWVRTLEVNTAGPGPLLPAPASTPPPPLCAHRRICEAAQARRRGKQAQ